MHFKLALAATILAITANRATSQQSIFDACDDNDLDRILLSTELYEADDEMDRQHWDTCYDMYSQPNDFCDYAELSSSYVQICQQLGGFVTFTSQRRDCDAEPYSSSCTMNRPGCYPANCGLQSSILGGAFYSYETAPTALGDKCQETIFAGQQAAGENFCTSDEPPQPADGTGAFTTEKLPSGANYQHASLFVASTALFAAAVASMDLY